MRYKYPATQEELDAVKYLKDRGWRVDEPRCPDCHGNGYLAPVDAMWQGTKINSYPECPRGCDVPTYFF